MNILIFLFFLLKPFYLFKSGMPQMADILMIFIFLITFFKKIKITDKEKNLIVWNLLFVVYIFIVNGVWALILKGELELIKQSVYYLYNFLVLITIIALYENKGNKFLKVIFNSIFVSSLLQFIILLFKDSTEMRRYLYFNNPNQLGYFSLLSIAICLVINYKLDKKINVYPLIGINLILIVASLSRGAFIGAILMVITYIILSINKRNFLKIYFLVIIIFVILISIVYLELEIDTFKHYRYFKFRVFNLDYDDNLSYRGYDRFINHSNYLILGAGEGVYKRFNSKLLGEVHSVLVNILFSYGIIGFIMFLNIIYISIYKVKFKRFHPLIYVFIYNMVHNGIRHSMFWILLALLSIIEVKKNG
ncbi:MAG: hypothetical protein FH751_16270 [Firmicutes bacterium]|nr:hypothetical protein [Bacillota bacterium]